MYVIDNDDFVIVVCRVHILNNNDPGNHTTVIIRAMESANGNQCYIVTLSAVILAYTEDDPCTMAEAPKSM